MHVVASSCKLDSDCHIQPTLMAIDPQYSLSPNDLYVELSKAASTVDIVTRSPTISISNPLHFLKSKLYMRHSADEFPRHSYGNADLV